VTLQCCASQKRKREASHEKSYLLKIERISGKRKTLICLRGQLRAEHLHELKSEVERGGPRVALDLEELGLVDIDGARFLNECASAGVSVLHCSPYKECMVRERGRPKEPPSYNKIKKGERV